MNVPHPIAFAAFGSLFAAAQLFLFCSRKWNWIVSFLIGASCDDYTFHCMWARKLTGKPGAFTTPDCGSDPRRVVVSKTEFFSYSPQPVFPFCVWPTMKSCKCVSTRFSHGEAGCLRSGAAGERMPLNSVTLGRSDKSTSMNRIIFADPPWVYRDKCHAGKRGAGYKYPLMAVQVTMWLVFGGGPAILEHVESMVGSVQMFEKLLVRIVVLCLLLSVLFCRSFE